MKNFTLFAMLFFMTLTGFSQNTTLVGKWEVTSKDKQGEQFEFKNDKTAYMIKEGVPSPTFTYEFDTNKTPNWVDLTVEEEDFSMKMKGLIEFIDEDTVKLELFPEDGSERPSQFTPVEASNDIAYVILKRM